MIPQEVIVIGGGKMGLLHGALLNASREARVVAVVDPSRQARLIISSLGLRTKSYSSVDDALKAHPDSSASFVCTPPGVHHAVAKQVLAAGHHVFIEKPLTTSGKMSRELNDLAEAKGLRGAVGYVRRHHSTFARLRAEVQQSSGVVDIEGIIRSPQFAGGLGLQGAHRGGLRWDLLPHVLDAAIWCGNLSVPDSPVLELETPGRIVARGSASGIPLRLEADWENQAVRKVELMIRARLASGEILACNEDMCWKEEQGERRILFQRRDAPAPWFDVAGPEFSLQTLDVLSLFRGEASISASLLEASRIDSFIERLGGPA